MKFSILLPTRNRLEYLQHAVETVRRQDFSEWELIISDNHSEEDIQSYTESLCDERIKYFRTDRFFPVTENWNNALNKSNGDYVIMLGDDDGLAPNTLGVLHEAIEKYEKPDVIYSRAFLYAYPGVMPGFPQGFLKPAGCADFLSTTEEPFMLDREHAIELAKYSLDFRLRFDYNMQYSTISREFIESLRAKGEFFQSPFPDYYASNVAFLKAERILVYPKPLVIVGITPKSYGFFHFNNRESEGMQFLNSLTDHDLRNRLRRVLLPGSNINNGWLLAMETIRRNFNDEFDLKVNYRRYRFLQIAAAAEAFIGKQVSRRDLWELQKQMRLWEKLAWGFVGALFLSIKKFLRPALRIQLFHKLKVMLGQYPAWDPPTIQGRYNNLLDVFEQFNKPVG